ncbi:GcrA family cell cycle regulator [Phyllobacterium sp. LjRoot231]|uniref:GcrA family cell cycle regulator n=1 Tax=Phyllobacterium sp. LjRoot231 TaxID=3342289 RepID=UPI003ECF592B
MNWTDERVEQLKKLWAEGLSASQIAAQLGGVSRNAVIGKVHRLKLSGRGKTTSTQTRSKKVNTSTSGGQRSSGSIGHMSSRVMNRSVGATALQAEYSTDLITHTVTKTVTDVVVPISRRLELVQLSERTCKWPVGDPLQPDFNFCGNDVGESGPYCTYHSRLAYQPASDRRRIR